MGSGTGFNIKFIENGISLSFLFKYVNNYYINIILNKLLRNFFNAKILNLFKLVNSIFVLIFLIK